MALLLCGLLLASCVQDNTRGAPLDAQITLPTAVRAPTARLDPNGHPRSPVTPQATFTAFGEQSGRRLSEDGLRDAEYTVCDERVNLEDGTGITNKPDMDYARQCKPTFVKVLFGDLDGDRFEDALVILYTYERSHQIPSAHVVVDRDGQPKESVVQELPWETEVVALAIVNREAVVTVGPGPNQNAPQTVRFRVP